MKVNLVNENFQSNYLKELLTTRGVTDIEKYFFVWCKCIRKEQCDKRHKSLREHDTFFLHIQ